jgi:hypothetical protein
MQSIAGSGETLGAYQLIGKTKMLDAWLWTTILANTVLNSGLDVVPSLMITK